MPTASSPIGSAPVKPARSLTPVLLAALVGLGLGDSIKPVSEQAGARLAIAAIDAYRSTVSPLLSRAGILRCRFQPTCSAYGREAITRYGLPRGAMLAAKRVVRCNPFSRGGNDPVP